MARVDSKIDQDDLSPESIAAFRNGDALAFEGLFRMHYPSLCYFALQFVGERAEAEDIARESYVKLWQARDGFNHAKAIQSFLYVTTRNACINHLKRQKTRVAYQDELAYLEENKREDLVLNRMIRAEFMQEIYAEIEKLPAQRRAVFKMAYFEGLKNDEIADRLKLSVFTVKFHKAKALATLRVRFSSRQLALFFFLCGQGIIFH